MKVLSNPSPVDHYRQQLRLLEESSPHILLYTTYNTLPLCIFTISPLMSLFYSLNETTHGHVHEQDPLFLFIFHTNMIIYVIFSFDSLS